MQTNHTTQPLSASTAGSPFIIGIIVLVMVGTILALKAVTQGASGSAATADEQPVTVEIANSWVELPLAERIALAELIVRAEVLNPLPSRWNTPDGQLPAGTGTGNIPHNTIIFTDTPVRVLEYLKGNGAGEELLVRTLGGTVGQVTMTAASAELQPGQEVILLLNSEAPEPWNVGPGHYWIVQGPLGVFEISGQDVLTAPTREHPGRMPLAELLSTITSAKGQGN